MKARTSWAALLGAALALAAGTVAPAATAAQDDPLAPFERLIGGRWYLGEDMFQTFAWGVGRRSVKAEAYAVGPSGPELVSELTWYWHPGDAAIRGHGVAVRMGVDFFEYTTRWEGATMVNDLRSWGPAAFDGVQRETWAFTDTDHYEWTLFTRVGDGWTREMGGTWERRPEPGGGA